MAEVTEPMPAFQKTASPARLTSLTSGFALEEALTIPLDKELRAYAKCPKGSLPNDVKPPSIVACAYKLLPYNPEAFNEKEQTAKVFGVEETLLKHNLMLVSLRSNISKIELNLRDNPVYVRCPRMPYDLDAKVGYRRSKYNPNKKERVFGYQVIISNLALSQKQA